MSIIFGIFDKTGQGFDKSWPETMKKDLWHGNPDRVDIWRNSNIALGNLSIFNTPESLHEILPHKDNESNLIIVSDSRIDNRNDLAKRLNVPDKELKMMPDSIFIIRTFQKYKTNSTSYLKGDFSFAIYDESKNRLYLARDHFGMRPLFYFNHPDYFVFSTELRGILTLPFFEKKLNENWLLDFLINVNRKEFDTFYEGIYSIPPGHHVIIEPGKMSLEKYWELTVPERIILKNDQEYIEGYKELFETAVKSRVRSAFPVGAELSGGLDSSSIVAVAQKILVPEKNPLHVFARVLPENKNPELDDPDDETKEIKLVCDFCGIANLHQVTMEDQKITENIRQIIEIIQTPYRSNYVAYNLNAHQYAKAEGVRTILSGHGGDQMLTNTAHFVYQDYLIHHWYLKLFNDIRAKGTIHKLDLINSFKYLYRLGFKSKNSSDKSKELKKFYRYGIAEDFIQKHQLKQIYIKNRKIEFFATKSLLDLIIKITHRHMNDRIEVTNLMAQHENIEFRYPLFDIDLIAFYLAIPDDMKYKFRYGRYSHRMAMENELPQQIQWRTDKHGTINPGLARIFSNDACAIKSVLKRYSEEYDNQNEVIFSLKMIEKLVSEPDKKLFDYKSVINKFFQLMPFEKIIDNKFA